MRKIDKISTAERAMSVVKDGDTVMIGGFGLRGCPFELIEALVNTNKKDLTIISNDLGNSGAGLGKLLTNKQVKKLIGNYYTWNPDVSNAYKRGEIDVQLIPQGTFAEAIRAGGVGIPGFYTMTSEGTTLGETKDTRVFDGKRYVLERSLRADVALIKGHKSDGLGNILYYKVSRNFNPLMAMAAKITIAQVEEIVKTGSMDPECIVTPHVFIDYIVKEVDNNECR